MTKLCRNLKKFSEEIGSLAAIIGVCVGIIGFGFTIFQIKSANNTLQATNAYQIQKDARELAAEVSRDEILLKALNGAKLNDAESNSLQKTIWKMNNFYLSVFRQSSARGISREFSSAFARDFCDFHKRKIIAESWVAMRNVGMVSQDHQNMKEIWCD